MLVWGRVNAEVPRIVGIVPRRAFLSKPASRWRQRVQQNVVGPEAVAVPEAPPSEGAQVPAVSVAVVFNSTAFTVGIAVHAFGENAPVGTVSHVGSK
jgi:hypothetical protein